MIKFVPGRTGSYDTSRIAFSGALSFGGIPSVELRYEKRSFRAWSTSHSFGSNRLPSASSAWTSPASEFEACRVDDLDDMDRMDAIWAVQNLNQFVSSWSRGNTKNVIQITNKRNRKFSKRTVYLEARTALQQSLRLRYKKPVGTERQRVLWATTCGWWWVTSCDICWAWFK